MSYNSSEAISLVSLDKVSHDFNYHSVLFDTSWNWYLNQYILCLGANGSGKTTLLNLLSQKHLPTKGKITFHSEYFKYNIGFISSDKMLYRDLTIQENLSFWISLILVKDKKKIHEKMNDVLNFLGLYEHRNKKVHQLSLGMSQRLNLARHFMYAPSILLLDEAFNGLDIKAQNILLDLLDKKGNPLYQWKIKSFIIVDHYYTRLIAYCSKILNIRNQKLIEYPCNQNSILLIQSQYS